MSEIKICVVTGSRAEYGLLYWFIKKVQSDKDLALQIIATGMHLSSEFGLTYREIEKDFKIDKKIDMDLSLDNSIGISKSMGIAQTYIAEAYKELQPDIVVVLGDRYEIFSAAIAAMIANIPIAHIHGGERSEGSIDDRIRHSISKMSHLHFTATEEYKNRVIQLGEYPDRVINVGGLGIENIKKLKLLSKKELENAINFKLNKKNLLVTFHPATLENNTSQEQFKELLEAIDELDNTNLIFTKSNSDLNGRIINKMIDNYTRKNPEKSVSFISLGQLRYLSTLKYMDAIIGNSSSGIIEAPSFNIGTINIGSRQKGRIKASSVIDCEPKKNLITSALTKLYSKDFISTLKNSKNLYGDGNSSQKIIDKIKTTNLKTILKKSFFDLNFKKK